MKLHTLSIISAFIMTTSVVNAASNAVPVGSNLGYGAASNNHSIFSISANPSWVSGNLHEENNYGFGLTAGIRIKQNNLSELYTNYKNNIEPIIDDFNNSDSASSFSKANDLKTSFNDLMLDIRDEFYLQADVNLSLPILVANSSFGAIGLELSTLGTVRAKILASNKPIDIDTAYLLANSGANFDDVVENGLIMQSALYIKTANVTEAALSYGNQFYQNQYGQLSVGVRAKYMQAKLVKSINSFDKYLKSNDINNQMNDDLSAHSDVSGTENAFGVDLGIQWFAENYMLGLSIMNVNSPTFNYNKLGTTNNVQGHIEQFYASQMAPTEDVTLDPQARIEGTFYSENRNWSIAASYDINSTTDLANQQYQWATASVAYASDGSGAWWNYLVPDLRLGYRTNLAGDERSYITPGVSWGFLNIDLGFADFADIGKATAGDTEDLPEALMANIGVEFYF